jgi:muramoyltetrapeptide carboxypeptidase
VKQIFLKDRDVTMSMKWEPLREGDVVDIIAPGFPTDSSVLAQAEEFLKSWNLVPRVPKNLLKKTLLFSNTDEARSSHLISALKSDSKVIWCLRGGYGAIRLLPELAKLKRPQNAKLLVGISDVTSLSLFLNENWKWPVLHGPLMDRMALKKVPAGIEKELKKILFGQQDQIEFPRLKALNSAAKSGKKVSASLVGGNMVTLQSAIGTPYDFSFKNKIAFFEEIGERGYKVDRILVHLEQAGYFKSCKGVIFGHFTGGEEPDGKNYIKHVLKAWAETQKFPVYSGVESGHGVNLRPLPLGTSAVIEKNKLIVDTGV